MRRLTSAECRTRITIARPVDVDDGAGARETSWVPVAQPWAKVEGMQGREAVISHALQGIAVYQLRFWHIDGVGPAMQIAMDAVTLNIRSIVDPFGDRRELLVLADTAGVEA